MSEKFKAFDDSGLNALTNHMKATRASVGDISRDLVTLSQATVEALEGKASVDHEHSWNDLNDKPFGEVPVEIVNESAITLNAVGNGYAGQAVMFREIADGDVCTVIINGITYENKIAYYVEMVDSICIGSFVLYYSLSSGCSREEAATQLGMTDTGEPFFFVRAAVGFGVIAIDGGSGDPCQLTIIGTGLKKIDNEYIDFSNMVGKYTEGGVYNVHGTDVTAKAGAEIFNDYENNIASGEYSHAEGSVTIAAGDCSHAEGRSTHAIGTASHAEGCGTQSYGTYTHAEGYCTYAQGEASHAEGISTGAYAPYSHAEGNYTWARGTAQHVQGKFNVEDWDNKYAHIVGNGEGIGKRSNAHTVNWDGTAWFAGDIYVGGTGQDDESAVKLVREDELTNKGYITGYTETDPTVPAWAKAATKPSYTYGEVGAAAANHTHDEYQVKLNGSSDQIVGFDSEGKPVAINKTKPVVIRVW